MEEPAQEAKGTQPNARTPRSDWAAKSLTVISALVAISGAVISALNVQNTRKVEQESAQISRDNSLRELRRPFVEQMFRVYTETVQQVSTIAAHSEHKLQDKDTTRFWELYSGEVRLIANREVLSLMDQFSQGVTECASEPKDAKEGDDRSRDMGRRSQLLADAMSRDLKHWTGATQDDSGARNTPAHPSP